MLSDNGAIYFLGVQPGTVVRGNHIHRVTAAGYGGDIRIALHTDANVSGFEPDAVPPCTHPEWRKAGHDRNSLVPRHSRPRNRHHLHASKNSPALSVGFKPYDWSICGPRPHRAHSLFHTLAKAPHRRIQRDALGRS